MATNGCYCEEKITEIVPELGRIYDSYNRRIADNYELTLTDVSVLILLSRHQYFGSFKEMSYFLNSGTTTVKKTVQRLYSRGFIKYGGGKIDSNGIHLVLNGLGIVIAREAQIQQKICSDKLTSGLSAGERLDLDKLIEKIHNNIYLYSRENGRY